MGSGEMPIFIALLRLQWIECVGGVGILIVIGHVHTGGNPGRGGLGGNQELNYPAIMRALREAGYQSYICHEFLPAGEPLPALAEAFRLCGVE